MERRCFKAGTLIDRRESTCRRALDQRARPRARRLALTHDVAARNSALMAAMDPIRKLRSELERDISRAWEGLTEGWRELLSRGSDALTRFVRVRKSTSGEESHGFPQWALLAAECWETAQSVIVRVELPGMRKEDIDVSIYHGRLQIRGERSSGAEEARQYHLMERAFGRFERSLSLPSNVDAARAEVSYQGGVITVILPKTEAVPPTQLSIK